MKYTKLVQFKDDEYDGATVVEEAKQPLKAGFDRVTEKNNSMLFRRLKDWAHPTFFRKPYVKTFSLHGKLYNEVVG